MKLMKRTSKNFLITNRFAHVTIKTIITRQIRQEKKLFNTHDTKLRQRTSAIIVCWSNSKLPNYTILMKKLENEPNDQVAADRMRSAAATANTSSYKFAYCCQCLIRASEKIIAKYIENVADSYVICIHSYSNDKPIQ